MENYITNVIFSLYKTLPEDTGAAVPKPPKLAPPNPADADVVVVLKPPNA